MLVAVYHERNKVSWISLRFITAEREHKRIRKDSPQNT